MEYTKRILDLDGILDRKSCFLFGPRQTGKSMLIRHEYPQAKKYNLLESGTYRDLNHRPEKIRLELGANDKFIVIDEIQKIPSLLDEVHLMIEEHGVRFLLTGSSSRSLKKKGVNLLAGRALSKKLHPFVYPELKNDFDLKRACQFGLIPSIYRSNDPWNDLKAYTDDYLKEEIAAEAIVRNIGAFTRFLEIAAISSGQLVNYTNLGADAQVHPNTVREHYQVLKDTLIASELKPFRKTLKRKSLATSKIYFFDIGLVRRIQGRKSLSFKSPEFGEAFEHFIFHELKSYCDYNQVENLNYWRTTSNFEVDFILNEDTAIEVKAKSSVAKKDLKGLQALKDEKLMRQYIMVTMTEKESIVDGVRILPWKIFLDELWAHLFVGS
jgi:uncharacterized protein